MNTFDWVVGTTVLLSLLTSCRPGETHQETSTPVSTAIASATRADQHAPHQGEDGQPPANHEHKKLARVIKLDPDAVREVGIKTVPVVRDVLKPTLSLSGEITADPDRSAKLSSPVPGHLEQVNFREGSTVKRGEVMALLRVPDLGRVKGAQSSVAAKARAAKSNAERLKSMYEAKLGAEQAWLDAKAEAEALDAEAQALASHLAGMGASGGSDFMLPLRAPLTGVVLQRNAIVGQPVPVDQVLATLADLSEVWFMARVFERDLGRLQHGAPAEINLNALTGKVFQGTIDYIAQQIDPIARTVTARVKLKNPDAAIRVGLYGSAKVEIQSQQTREPALLIPRSAVVEVMGKPMVFVQLADAPTYEIHEVVLGENSVGMIEVVLGLLPGEKVVVDGTFTLKSAALKGTLEDGD